MVDGIQVHTFDTRLASMIEGSYVIYTLKLIEDGATPNEIIEELTSIRKDTGILIC